MVIIFQGYLEKVELIELVKNNLNNEFIFTTEILDNLVGERPNVPFRYKKI